MTTKPASNRLHDLMNTLTPEDRQQLIAFKAVLSELHSIIEYTLAGRPVSAQAAKERLAASYAPHIGNTLLQGLRQGLEDAQLAIWSTRQSGDDPLVSLLYEVLGAMPKEQRAAPKSTKPYRAASTVLPKPAKQSKKAEE